MRIKFDKDVDHWHSKGRCTAYKNGGTYTVPHEFGQNCVKDGAAIEVAAKPNTKANKPNKSVKPPAEAEKTNGD